MNEDTTTLRTLVSDFISDFNSEKAELIALASDYHATVLNVDPLDWPIWYLAVTVGLMLVCGWAAFVAFGSSIIKISENLPPLYDRIGNLIGNAIILLFCFAIFGGLSVVIVDEITEALGVEPPSWAVWACAIPPVIAFVLAKRGAARREEAVKEGEAQS